MITNIIRIIFIIALLLSSSMSGYADPAITSFNDLKKRSLSIRNTDLQLRRVDEWRALAAGLEAWSHKNSSRREAADALFTSGIMWRILFQGSKDPDFAVAVERVWLRLVDKYDNSSQADDALLKLGELYLVDLGDKDTARKYFERVVREYPTTDSAAVAEQRLSSESRDQQVREDTSAAGDGQTVIVLDPGHGGEDLGAMADTGLLEKDIVLIVALELERLLNKQMDVKVVLTRRSDVFVPLAARTQLANDNAADLFVSIHVNSSETGKASGLEVYYLDNTDNQASQKLAERENASMAFGGQPDDLQLIMSDMIQNAKLEESQALAKVFDQHLTSYLSKRWPAIRSLGVKKAPFFVLVGAHMPCVLVELFFINHANDGANLIKRDFRHDLAQGLYRAIEHYIASGKIAK